MDQLWKLWNTHYLQELREAHRHFHKLKRGEVMRPPEEGEVVLIKDNQPRSTWKMGRVKQLYQGDDGEVRFVKLKLPSGNCTKRGIKDLVPLELRFDLI